MSNSKKIVRFFSESQVIGLLSDFCDFLDFHKVLNYPDTLIDSSFLVEKFIKNYNEVK